MKLRKDYDELSEQTIENPVNLALLKAAKAAKDLIDQEYGPDHLPDEYYQLRAAIAQAEGEK